MFGVKVKRSRLWIPALGGVIAIGFFINFVLAPHIESCRPINWLELFAPFALITGIGSIRDIKLRKFIYLGPLDIKPLDKKKVLSNKLWIPSIGWCLVLGYANNLILAQFIESFKVVDSYALGVTLFTLLGISGYRDVGIYREEKTHNPSIQIPTQEESEKAKPADF